MPGAARRDLRQSNWKSPREFRAISATVNCAYTPNGTRCAAIRDSKHWLPRLLRRVHDPHRIPFVRKSDTALLWDHIMPGSNRLWFIRIEGGHLEQPFQQCCFTCGQMLAEPFFNPF